MNRRVLIIDDSLTVRMDLQDTFAGAGFDVVLAGSLAEARRALDGAPVVLVLLDVVLPDGDGVELLRELKSAPATAAVPVMLLSTEADVRDRVRGLKTGADDYVGKPYDSSQVLERARLLIGARDGSGGGDGPLVLIIDDSPTFREGLRASLQAAGYRVAMASSGEEGLRTAFRLRPGAVIVDNVMTGIDGPTVIRRLRQDAVLRPTPCLLLTGSEDRQNEVKALEAGADAYVRKEDDLELVLARLAAMVRTSGGGAAAPSSDEEQVSFLGPKRIMAVDDSDTYLQALAGQLRDESYDVVLARSGEEALELLAVQPVDCILLDLQLPTLSGQETCRRIKKSPSWCDIPLLVLTGRDDREAMVDSINAGADDFVAKSSDFAVLKARMRAQLRRRQFEDERRSVREQKAQRDLQAAEARSAQALAETRAKLLAELQLKNEELSRAKDEVEEKNRRIEEADRIKTEFFTNVSHELRTPLNSIIGFSELLIDGTPGALNDVQQRYLNNVHQSGRHLLGLINDLLDQAKLEAGRLEVVHEACAPRIVAEEAVATLQPLAGAKQIALEVADRTAAPTPLVAADVLRFRQVLYNLISNAIKFTPEGGRIELRSEATADGAWVRTCVSDNGPGIAPESLPRLFTPFTQLKASSGNAPNGTGLGLSLSKKLVELMGGRIGVDSTVGQGSTFFVELPVHEGAGLVGSGAVGPRRGAGRMSPAPALLTTATADATNLRGRTTTEHIEMDESGGIFPSAQPLVLVVDDTEEVREYVVGVLGKEYRIETAADGREGLDKALALHPDLVLSDIMMPGLDGVEMVHAIREHGELAATPIIMLTAKADDETRIELLQHGAQDYLLKPFSAAELRARVGNLVATKRARDLLQEELQSHHSSIETLVAEVVARRRDAEKALEWMSVAREQAERANAAKSEFVAMVSHELRTPLTSLLLSAQRLANLSDDAPAKGRQSAAGTMIRSSERLLRVVEELLDFARVQAGRLTPRSEPFDLKLVLMSIVKEYEGPAEEKGLALRYDDSLTEAAVQSDQTLVGVVISNLLSNAIKFTERGAVEVTLGMRGDAYVVSVKDSGPGIPEEARNLIFEPFAHLEPVQRKHTPGIGLGLALVREIVTALGGRIELTSRVGAGSTFVLTLPLKSKLGGGQKSEKAMSG